MRKSTALFASIMVGAIALSIAAPAFASPPTPNPTPNPTPSPTPSSAPVSVDQSFADVYVVAGTRSAMLDEFTFQGLGQGAEEYSHLDQVFSGVSTLTIDDSSGTGLGWAVTEQVSDVTWVSNGGAVAGVTVAAADYSVSSVDAVSTIAGQAWSGSTAVAGALDSPVTVLAANVGAGSGRYTVPVNFTLRLPGTSRIGSYTATLTTTMSVSP